MAQEKSGVFIKSRLEAFSDGIFAIIITLLVLEIRVPHIENGKSIEELLSALLNLLPKILSWIISFFTICVIWVNHHRLFKMYREITHGLFWWNAFLLLWVSFIPFPTALMGDYSNNFLAVFVYGMVMGMMALSFSLMRFYVNRNIYVLNETVDANVFKKGAWISVIMGPLPYFSGALLSMVHPYISFAIYLFIPIYFIFPHATKD
jgi:uncharacterized membrane protein